MGGRLEVIARIPEGAVKIGNFADIDHDPTRAVACMFSPDQRGRV